MGSLVSMTMEVDLQVIKWSLFFTNTLLAMILGLLSGHLMPVKDKGEEDGNEK